MEDKERRPSKKNSKKENKKYPYKKNRKIEIEKSHKRNIVVSIVFGVIIGMIFMLYLHVVYNVMYGIWVSFSPFFNQLRVFSFTTVSEFWEDEKVVDNLAYLCYLRETDREKIYCVYDFVKRNTNVDYHHRYSNILRKPEELFSKSVVCRDVSVLLKSVYTKMGFENEFIFIDEEDYSHVYNKVYLDEEVCYVDAMNFDFECEEEI